MASWKLTNIITYFLLSLCLLYTLSDARCRDDQAEECRTAVAGHNLMNIASGGVCTPNTYDIYDHLCTLNVYTGGIDYCCCAHENNALCCRFHYDHNYFRCDEEEDSISLPPSITTVVVSVAVILVVIAVIIPIVVKCVKGKRSASDVADNPDDSSTPKLNNADNITEELQLPLNPERGAAAGDGQEEDNSCHVSCSDARRLEPTAPMDGSDAANLPLPPRYERFESQPADLHPCPSPLHGSRHELFRSESDNFEDRRHLQMLPEPPPAYDEHHEHRLYVPEVNNTARANWL